MSGSYAFSAEQDHNELLGRIAKVRLAKALKIRGRSLDGVAWEALDRAQAEHELCRLAPAAPDVAGLDGRARLHGILTEEEFDRVLEPKEIAGALAKPGKISGGSSDRAP